MAETSYTYTLLSFPNHKVASDRLLSEIRASSIVTAVGYINTDAANCYIFFKDALSTGDKNNLDALVAAHSGEPLPSEAQPVSVTNSSLTVNAMPPSGMKSNQISQNWCDKTTWWYSATHVSDETATTVDPERKVWSLAHQNVIDTYHGKLTGEEALPDYLVVVKVGGVTKGEQDPHYGTGGDYTVNYAAGTITFLSAVPGGTDPVVSYYHETGSTWIISPAAGEVWKLKGAESQFSDDVDMTDSMVYEVWAYDPNDPPNKMMVAFPDYYKTMSDFVNDANKAYPTIPAFGSPTNWRASKRPITVFAWDFQTTTPLVSSWGMELRVRLEHDTPYAGTFATGTFYFIREQE
jgi:hypothetical protein